jgi:hypothetical protein
MGWLAGVVMMAALGAAPVAREAAQPRQEVPAAEKKAPEVKAPDIDEALAAAVSYPSSVCKKKRVDACGCHHVYGTRHCHPDRKGKHCEAIVRAELPWSDVEPVAYKL